MRFLVLTILLLFMPLYSYGINNIDLILKAALDNNFDIKAAKVSTARDSIEFKMQNNLKDPEVGFEYAWGDKNVGNKWAMGISQSFEWPGVYNARNKSALEFIKALDALEKQKCLEVLTEVKDMCLQIIYINKHLMLNELIEQNMKEINDAYNKGFEHGEVTIIDINKLKVELLNISKVKKDYNRQKIIAVNSLKSKLGDAKLNNNMLLSLSAYPEISIKGLDEFIDDFIHNDPKYSYFLSMDSKLKRDKNLNKMSSFPEFSVGYKYINELGDGFHGLMASFSLPVFSNRGKRDLNHSMIVNNTYEQSSYKLAREAEIFAKYDLVVSLRKQVDEYSAVLGDKENFRILKKALDAGQIDLLTYLTEIKYFIEAENNLLDLEYELQRSYAELDKYRLI